MYNRHGEHIEPQAGLFSNAHSSDFVKMYFGRVAPFNTHDGFLVTQFLDKKIACGEVRTHASLRYLDLNQAP